MAQPNRVACGITGTGTGMATVSLASTDPACTLSSMLLLPVSAAPTIPPPGASGFPHGFVDFSVSNCSPGATIDLSMAFPSALPPNTQYWAYGPTPDNHASHWYVIPSEVDENLVRFSITDNGQGDKNVGGADGAVLNFGGAGGFLDSIISGIPALGEYGLKILSAVLGLLGVLVLFRRRRRHGAA
jgi:hypothetical protein